ncbi:MAG: hypothetical protein ACK5KR_02205 [Breznakia sp.]
MKNIKMTRSLGFLIDYAIWYLLMYIMILIYFFGIEKYMAFSGNLSAYGDLFANIMSKPSFLFLYIGVLFIYEVCIPIFFGGKTISKKILKTKMVPFHVSSLFIRGGLKLLIINPCGVVSYVLANMIGGSAALIADGLWLLLIVNIVLALLGKSTMYDFVAKTNIEYIEGKV